MTSLAQFLLVMVITTLTILVSVVAVQVWQILAEVRQAMKKLNRILDNTQTPSEVKELVDLTQEETIEPKRRFFHRSGLPLRPS